MARLASFERTLGFVTVAAALLALSVALIITPSEVVMGQSVRILYVHAGAAWTAYLAYAVTALGAAGYLVQRRSMWDHIALASAEWGVVLTTVTLLTGMLWGKVAQGWWWRWDDTRLTLTLMLWFLYAAYLILRQYTEGERRARLSAVLALVGVPAMVLNHFAVTLFPAFHPQPVAARPDGPALAGPFVLALSLSFVTYTLLYVFLLVKRVRLEVLREQLATLAPRG